jgi:class 3 adenylate cyclase
VGTVTNLAFRLCSEAKAGQIIVTRRVLAAVEELVSAQPLGDLTLHGFTKPVPAFTLQSLAG